MSPADKIDARLPARAEELLAEWPVAEPDDAGWEERARAIEARLSGAARDSSSALLRPPFPSSPGEEEPGQRPSSPRLADIARAVRESKPDQNVNEIARASLSIASRARASAPEAAAKVRAAQASRPSVETPLPLPRVEPPTTPAPSNANRTLPVLAILGSGLALAAAVALFVGSSSQPEPAASEPAARALPSAAAPAAMPPVARSDERVTVEELQPQPAEVEGSRVAARPMRSSPKGGGAAAKPERPATAGKTSRPEPSARPTPAEARDPELKPADGPNSLPEKPSTGAVQAALGSVIGGARACVTGHDRPSSATLVFGSDGRVKSVTVGGAAAGTPAAACIRSALEKARVSPFAKSTFSAQVAIRPN